MVWDYGVKLRELRTSTHIAFPAYCLQCGVCQVLSVETLNIAHCASRLLQ